VQSGYSRITDTVSMLVWGSHGWLETILFCLNGVFLLLFALRLYRASRDTAGKAGIAMLALAGVSFIIIASCPTLAPGAEPSLRSQAHEYAARGISAIFPLACLLLALSWKSNPAYKNIVNWTIAFGVIGLMLNCIGLFYVAGDLEWIGALERLIILNGFAWLAVLGLHFCHTTHQEHYPTRLRVSVTVAYRARLCIKAMPGRLSPQQRQGVPVYSNTLHNMMVRHHAADTDNVHITRRAI